MSDAHDRPFGSRPAQTGPQAPARQAGNAASLQQRPDEADWPATASRSATLPSEVSRSGVRPPLRVQSSRPEAASPSITEPSEVRPQEDLPQEDLTGIAPAGSAGPSIPGLFAAIAKAQAGHVVQLTVAAAGDGKVRVTAVALPKRTEHGSSKAKADKSKKGQQAEPAPALPFEPVSAVDRPEAFDDPETGLVRVFTGFEHRERTLAQLRAETERQNAIRVKAEERQAAAAKRRADAEVQAAEGGTLFGASEGD